VQSIETFPSVGCVGSGPGKSVALFMDVDLNFLFASSGFDALLPSVVSANIDVLPLSVVSSYCQDVPFSVVSENSGDVVSLKSICSVVFVRPDRVAKLTDLCITKPVSDLTHDICFSSFDIWKEKRKFLQLIIFKYII
jgi:hypothetical protein